MEFAKALFELRRGQGLSQEELAARVGVSRQAVSKWETGEAMPDLNKLLALSEALGVSLDRLCGRKERIREAELRPATERKRRGFWPILCALLTILVLLLLLQIGNLYKSDGEAATPVEVAVVEMAFHSSNGHRLRYYIVPSVICEGCTYQLQLTPNTPVFGAPDPIALDPASGVFQGEIAFPLTASQWSVSLRVNDGKNTYMVPVATQLCYTFDQVVSWTPAE